MAGLLELLKSAPPLRVRALLYRALTHIAISDARRRLKNGDSGPTRGPILVSGLFGEPSGLGRAADLTLAALTNAHLKPNAVALRPLLSGRATDIPSENGGAWIMHCNPDEAVRVFARISPDLWLGRRRIAYWAWELERTPKHWVAASSLFHEVWVPSTFVADALRSSGINSPIRVMPHPVSIGALAVKPDRARWGFAEGQLAVVVMGDLGSSAARKNIIGAIDIYREAFPAGSASKLLVKIVRSDASFLAATRAHIGDRPDIRIVTETAPPKDVMSLIASADVLLSPHRSEGFGLTLAEAMLLGTPALATGWSGNIDFMGELGDLLIDYRFVTVKDPVGIYREKGLRWAEPGFDDAIAKLRRLAASEEMRIALTARGAAIVRSFEQSWSRDSLLQSALGSVLA